MVPLFKTTIIVWSEVDPQLYDWELEDLAREAVCGDSHCSKMTVVAVADPSTDPDWDGTDFFEEEIP
jgi:hypothetical protein